MENNQKHIIENIRNHREEIDMDDLWADVSLHIPKEKQKRKIGFWIFSGLALLVMVVGVSWIVNTGDVEGDDKLAINEKSFESRGIQALNSAELTAENTRPNLKVEKRSDINTELENAINTKVNLNVKSPSALTNSKHKASNYENENRVSLLKVDEVGNNILSLNRAIISSQDNDSKIYASSEKAEKTVTVDEFITKAKGQNQVLVNEEREIAEIVPFLNQEFNLLSAKRDLNDLDLRVSQIEIEQPRRNRWDVYVLGGGAITNRKLNTRIIELQPERDRRLATVDVLGSWELEGGVGYRISSKLKVMTGLNYTQIHEKATFETDYLVDYEVKTENRINFQNGNEVTETGSTTTEGIRHTEEIRYNQLRLFQIPVKLSYELLNFDNLKINMGAFAAYSFQQKYVGVTSFSGTSESYDLELDKENKFRKSGSMSYGLFIEGTTHISRLIDLSFNLGYRQTNNINTEIYLIDQKYNSLSFTSGISRRF